MNACLINRWLGTLFVAACIGSVPLVAKADSYVVPPGTAGANPQDPFSSWTTAATNIQAAVNAAATSGWSAVWVSNGTYTLTTQIVITNNIALRSWKDGVRNRDGTVINGNAASRCFFLSNANIVFDGFTISNGFAATADMSGYGGGIYMAAGNMLTNCLFISNAAGGYGGAIYMSNTTTRVNNCDFVGNRAASYGGGLHVDWGINVLSRCVFTNNTGLFGGGLSLQGNSLATGSSLEVNTCYFFNNNSTGGSDSEGGGGFSSLNQYGPLVLTGCVFRGNTTANSGGGGVWIRRSRGNGIPEIRNCTIEYNVSTNVTASILRSGCGVGIADSQAIITDCLISSNYSTLNGYAGGLYIKPYTSLGVLVDRCTIVSNYAPSGAGGVLIYSADTATNNTATIIRNSLVAWNTAGRHGGGGIDMYPVGMLENCTIVSNRALHATEGVGGGVKVRAGGTDRRIINTIIYDNYGQVGGAGANWSFDSNVAVSNSCSTPSLDAYGSGNKTNNPVFKDVQTGNFRLTSGSPCINTGLVQGWMTDGKDLDGRARMTRDMVDMGAYRYIFVGSLFTIR